MADAELFSVQHCFFRDLYPVLKRNGFTKSKKEAVRIPQKEWERLLGRIAVNKNGLYYQIARLKWHDFFSLDALEGSVHLPELLYLDFSGLSLKDNLVRAHKEEIKALFHYGFEVEIVDGFGPRLYHFMPFEKSGSMGRALKIAFVSERGYNRHGAEIPDFLSTLQENSFMGLTKKDGGKDPLAKRYSYRGLLLSGGKRVDLKVLAKRGCPLNEHTVLVVPDEEAKADFARYFTQVSLGPKKGDDSYCSFEEETKLTEDEPKINCNDGFGFLSPKMSKEINAMLGFPASTTSYQIRLPFVKGMLHRVNFVEFAKEHFRGQSFVRIRFLNEDLEIEEKDIAFEDLEKIQMILTESMFKCVNELRYWNKNGEIDDCHHYYFDYLRKAEHSLFIVNHNGKGEEMTTLNSQFLSTADIGKEEFLSLLGPSLAHYRNLLHDRSYRIEHIKNRRGEEDSPLRLESELIKACPDAIDEPYFKNKIRKELDGLAKSIGYGNLLVQGEDRYLCGDPLRLLYYCFCLYFPESKRIGPSFVAPGLKGEDGQLAAVLRNPHLSRNEDLTLSLFVPEQDDERNQYGLSKLTGLCEIDPLDASLPAEMLSGADYDGDHVKIILDPVFTEALAKYEPYPIFINKAYRDDFDPKLNQNYDTYGNKATVTLNTFDSSVGQISNLALKEALKGYARESIESGQERLVHQNRVRLFGIFTGLETDSGKTGIKPDFLPLASAIKKNGALRGEKPYLNVDDYYIKFKRFLDDGLDKKELKEDFPEPFLLSSLDLDTYSESFQEAVGRSPSPVELLIPTYFSLCEEEKATSSHQKNLIPWAPHDEAMGLNLDRLEKTRQIIHAYSNTKRSLFAKRKVEENNVFLMKKMKAEAEAKKPGQGASVLVENLIDALSSIQNNDEFNRLKAYVDSTFFPEFVYSKTERAAYLNDLVQQFLLPLPDSLLSLLVEVPFLLKQGLQYASRQRSSDSFGKSLEELQEALLYSLRTKDKGKLSSLLSSIKQAKESLHAFFAPYLAKAKQWDNVYNRIGNLYLYEAYIPSSYLRSRVDEVANAVYPFLKRENPSLAQALDFKEVRHQIYCSTATAILHSLDIQEKESLLYLLNEYRFRLENPPLSKIEKSMIDVLASHHLDVPSSPQDHLESTHESVLSSLKGIAKKELFHLFDEDQKEAFRYVRALQKECDPQQAFLFAVFSEELPSYYGGSQA